MDQRCPRHLEDYPDSWCYSAVMRLKSIRNADHELSEEEESKLPGCPWSINCGVANYCFFYYVQVIIPERQLTDIEIAGLLNISVDSVRKIERSALSKLRKDSKLREYGVDISV